MEKYKKMTNNIHKGHRERLRNQLLKGGIDNFSDYQIVEMLLAFTIPYKDTNPLAHRLLDEFGSLANILDAQPDELCKISGIGTKTATFLTSLPDVFRVYKISKSQNNESLNSPKLAYEYFESRIPIIKDEMFYYACLDNSNHVIKFSQFGRGGISHINVNIRDFTNEILKVPTCGVIICHTHTSGQPRPSFNDIEFTKKLLASLRLLGISLLEHIILSPSGFYSFCNARLIDEFNIIVDKLLSDRPDIAAPQIQFRVDNVPHKYDITTKK